MAIIGNDRWLSASDRTVAAWIRQGHQMPEGVRRVRESLNPSEATVNRLLGVDVRPPARPTKMYQEPRKSNTDIGTALRQKGYTPERVVELSRLIDIPSLIEEAPLHPRRWTPS